MAQKYKILIDDIVVSSGYASPSDYDVLDRHVENLKGKVKEGVIVKILWHSPNR